MPYDRLQIAGVLGKYGYASPLPPIPVRQRRAKLIQFKKLLSARQGDICRVMSGDLWRPPEETADFELMPLIRIISYLIKNLPALCRDRRIKDSFFTFPSFSRTVAEPYGRVLIAANWNYPFLLSLEPALGAYAAGNRVVLKLSRRTPRAMHLIIALIEEVFATDEILPIGDLIPLDELLTYRYDFIFAAVNRTAAKRIMRAAAEFLTPLSLHTGGRNPCIIARRADLHNAARRIAWSKFINAGQNAAAPDYLFIHRELKAEFLTHINAAIRKFYSDLPLEKLKIASMPDRTAYERICKLIADGRLIVGGDRDPGRFAIEPTVIDQLLPDTEIFRHEIFGPVLPVKEFFSDEELLSQLKRTGRPLAVYCFGGSNFLRENICRTISAGAVVFDDALIQYSNLHFPCGGIGDSGFGAFHGKLTFETFCHRKPVMYKSAFPDLPPRYPDSSPLLKLLFKIFGGR